jgi:threonine dehydrogenase-like Zn-dependent dehydrogenase
LVALADHREASVRTAAEQLVAAGHKALAIRCDVADERQVAAMVGQTVSAFGGWMRLSTMLEFDRVNAMRLVLHEIRATSDAPARDDLIPNLLACSDVLGTGWFAADAADVKPGATVVVVGDGAVGLLGILSAKH